MMVEAGLAKELEISIWKDTLSNVVDECNAAGYKVTHDMVKLEVHFVMGEVGGGTHQTWDGNNEGELFMSNSRDSKSKNKHKR